MSTLWFRAYHKKYGMIYPDESFSLEDAIRGDLFFFGSPAKDYDVEDFTFMLFTGIRNKEKGTWIYKDDIVSYASIDAIGVVTWIPSYAGFGIISLDDPLDKMRMYMLHDGWDVIGNIWENKDLLLSS